MQQPITGRGSDAADKDFLQLLRHELEREISNYVHESTKGGVGTPLTSDEIRALVNSMRLCLVEPCLEEVNICNTSQESRTGVGVKRMCVTMAEDSGYVLVFDPVDGEYHLAWRGENGLGTWGIRGHGVECFIAR